MDTTDNKGTKVSGTPCQDGIPGEGWTVLQDVHIPEPTYMPVVMALGIVCILWGITTTPLMSLVGAVLFVISIVGWIGDLRHEHRHSGTE